MKDSDIIGMRLANHHLTRPDFRTPEEVVSYFGAVQAQDYAAAKWSVGMRMEQGFDEMVEKACDEGHIIRTHILRPTWHFVAPHDIRSLLRLTSQRVHAASAYMYRKIGLDADTMERSKEHIANVLTGRYMTRQELAETLARQGLNVDGLRITYMVMNAELEGVICNGPRRGKQHTYALLDERVPPTPVPDREESLAQLAYRYFRSHGPAQVADFSWWSGLPMADARNGIELSKPRLRELHHGGKVYYMGEESVPFTPVEPLCMLISIYDEYAIAYKDRSALDPHEYYNTFMRMGNAVTGLVMMNGVIVGSWTRVLATSAVSVRIRLFQKLTASEQDELASTLERYGKFLRKTTASEVEILQGV